MVGAYIFAENLINLANASAFTPAVISRVHRPLPYIDRSSSLDEDVLCGADMGSQDSTEGLNHINGGCGGEAVML